MRDLVDLILACNDAELEGRHVLDDYSLVELARIYNGIGPDRFPDWLRAIITEANGLFEPAALIHDVRYHIGGNEIDFTDANAEFHRNCRRLVLREYPWWSPVRYILLNKARRWAGYCQEFGWPGYNKREV